MKLSRFTLSLSLSPSPLFPPLRAAGAAAADDEPARDPKEINRATLEAVTRCACNRRSLGGRHGLFLTLSSLSLSLMTHHRRFLLTLTPSPSPPSLSRIALSAALYHPALRPSICASLCSRPLVRPLSCRSLLMAAGATAPPPTRAALTPGLF